MKYHIVNWQYNIKCQRTPEYVHKGVPETVTQHMKQVCSETLYDSNFPNLEKLITTETGSTTKQPTAADAEKQVVSFSTMLKKWNISKQEWTW